MKKPMTQTHEMSLASRMQEYSKCFRMASAYLADAKTQAENLISMLGEIDVAPEYVMDMANQLPERSPLRRQLFEVALRLNNEQLT